MQNIWRIQHCWNIDSFRPLPKLRAVHTMSDSPGRSMELLKTKCIGSSKSERIDTCSAHIRMKCPRLGKLFRDDFDVQSLALIWGFTLKTPYVAGISPFSRARVTLMMLDTALAASLWPTLGLI